MSLPSAVLVAGALWNSFFYRRIVLVGGSLAIVLTAGLWLVERAFDVNLGLI